MKVFLSWSGEKSKKCAEVLGEWLPYINQGIQVFVSSRNIEKGERPLVEIASQLQGSSYGIISVTRENQAAPWINFESGALSRELDSVRVVPFLVDLPVRDLSGPLTQFQAVVSEQRNDVFGMVRSLNGKSENPLDENRLANTFERFWPDLQSSLEAVRAESYGESSPPRSTEEILDELLKLTREHSAHLARMADQENQARRSNSVINIHTPRDVNIAESGGRPAKNMRRVTGELEALVRRHGIDQFTIDVAERNAGYDILLHIDRDQKVSSALLRDIESFSSEYGIFIHVDWGAEKKSYPF